MTRMTVAWRAAFLGEDMSELRYRMCTGKVTFRTRRKARAAARAARRKYHARALRAYKCAFCIGYHVGHSPRVSRVIESTSVPNKGSGWEGLGVCAPEELGRGGAWSVGVRDGSSGALVGRPESLFGILVGEEPVQ